MTYVSKAPAMIEAIYNSVNLAIKSYDINKAWPYSNNGIGSSRFYIYVIYLTCHLDLVLYHCWHLQSIILHTRKVFIFNVKTSPSADNFVEISKSKKRWKTYEYFDGRQNFDIRRRYFNGFYSASKKRRKSVENRRRNFDCAPWSMVKFPSGKEIENFLSTKSRTKL